MNTSQRNPSPRLWIQSLETTLPFSTFQATHLEVRLDFGFTRLIALARAWFNACPEPSLELQIFSTNLLLLNQTSSETVAAGVYEKRPVNLEPSSECVASVNIARETLWFEFGVAQDEVYETSPITLEQFPKPEPEPVPLGREVVTQVTLALELGIRHDGVFTEAALEELLHNLDFALEQQRTSSSLAPESLDAITEHFVFRDLDIRLKSVT